MEIITNKIKNIYSLPNTLNNYFPKNNLVVFDIETNGINPNFNKVILIGMLYIDNNEIILKQFFANKSKDEKKLLESFIDELKGFDIYLTFNGNSFDIPFLNKRLKNNNIDFEIDPYPNIDLFRIIKRNKDILGLNNCKLKTLENYLGINRDDTISGKESVYLYKMYEATQDEDLKKKILLHNYEDILHLLPTSMVLDHLKLEEIFELLPNEIQIETNKSLKARVYNYKLYKDFININGCIIGNIDNDYIYYNNAYSYSILKSDNSFEVRLPLLNIELPDNNIYSFINIDEIDLLNRDLSSMEYHERNKYLISKNKIKEDINIHNIAKEVLQEIGKRVI